MKRIITVLLCAFICLSAMTACSVSSTGSQSTADSITKNTGTDAELHTLYFKDCKKREAVTAVFSNSSSDITEEVGMTAAGEDNDGYIYTCEGDASTYNMVHFSYDGFNTTKTAFNKCVSGWYNSENGFLPFTYGTEGQYEKCMENHADTGDTFIYDNEMFDDVTLTFNGYDKVIHIRTPDGYDPSSDEKYATVYLLDGQVMVYLGFPGETLLNSEHADIQVQSMAAANGYKAVVVAIDTFGDPKHYYERMDEMIPDIGELAYDERTARFGNLLSDFISDTVVPYMREHYSVYTDALHTSIVGKSLGGLEAFYIAMERPDIFGTAGVLSPSFMLYSDEVWRSYLGQKDFNDQTPFLYFYSGNGEQDNGDVTDEMVERITDMGYPEDRFVYHREEIGGHEVPFWRSIFSEFLSAMVYQRVDPLSNNQNK